MFTGIVQDIGRIEALEPRDGDVRLTVAVERLDLARTRIGDSIAVAGACLTAVVVQPHTFSADVSRETLSRTTVHDWRVGRRVNLEPALRAGDALGGHLVAGHVDGVAEVRARSGDARSQQLRLRVPLPLAHYVARKGSVTLDGVSLTVNAVQGEEFEVNLVPHTLTVTTLDALAVGDRVNFEADMIARYIERLVQPR
ncbi:MAG TPA: riboflavin synthase [Steroidobacteraceae bacterium]|jgi:riboflavin synthase|nr:riboflavin synthase [Steroidobacteraceae bacterium]